MLVRKTRLMTLFPDTAEKTILLRAEYVLSHTLRILPTVLQSSLMIIIDSIDANLATDRLRIHYRMSVTRNTDCKDAVSFLSNAPFWTSLLCPASCTSQFCSTIGRSLPEFCNSPSLLCET